MAEAVLRRAKSVNDKNIGLGKQIRPTRGLGLPSDKAPDVRGQLVRPEPLVRGRLDHLLAQHPLNAVHLLAGGPHDEGLHVADDVLVGAQGHQALHLARGVGRQHARAGVQLGEAGAAEALAGGGRAQGQAEDVGS